MALDFYPSEVVTPPLALVALLGCPSLHGRVGEYLRAAQKPPINSLGVADPSAAPRLFGAPAAPVRPEHAHWRAPCAASTCPAIPAPTLMLAKALQGSASPPAEPAWRAF